MSTPTFIKIDVMSDECSMDEEEKSDSNSSLNIQEEEEETQVAVLSNDYWPNCVERNTDGTLSVNFNHWNQQDSDASIFKTIFDSNFIYPMPWSIIHKMTTDEKRLQLESTISGMPMLSFMMYTPTIYMMLHGLKFGSKELPASFDKETPSLSIIACYYRTIRVLLESHSAKIYTNVLLDKIKQEHTKITQNNLNNFEKFCKTRNGLLEIANLFKKKGFPQNLDYLKKKDMDALNDFAKHIVLFTINLAKALEMYILRLSKREWINIGPDNQHNRNKLNQFASTTVLPNTVNHNYVFSSKYQKIIDEKNAYIIDLKGQVLGIDISKIRHSDENIHSGQETRRINTMNIRDLIVLLTMLSGDEMGNK